MIYSEIKDVALQYSMRKDAETIAMMDNFLRLVESRMDRALSIREMFYRAVLVTEEAKGYYGLPAGFMAMRDIQVQETIDGGEKLTPIYASPEEMNKAITNGDTQLMYTIIANQIQVNPTSDDQLLEIVYRKRIPPLTDKDPENWASVTVPDAYIFGLLVEISAFAKDEAAAQLWEARFSNVMSGLQSDDDESRWSGPQLRIRLG